MTTHEGKLHVQVDLDSDAPAEELDQLTTRLAGELLELDVEAVERPRTEEPPPGTRAVEAAALGELLVTLSPAVLGAVVETTRSWLSRSRDRSARLRLGDEEIEISGASSEEQQQLITAFLARQAEG